MDTAGKEVLVFGLGISGIGAGSLLEKRGARVVLYDGNEKLDKDKIREQLGEDSSARIITGPFPEELLGELDLVVLSPGVPTDLPVIEKMREMGIEIIGEIELAYLFGRGEILAITGTNGKTTTTTLTGEIFAASGRKTHVVGNIGTAVISESLDADEDDWLVTETSSFQLETGNGDQQLSAGDDQVLQATAFRNT